MSKVVVVGSGASGVHFALTLLRKGYEVELLDVGHAKGPMVNPEDNFSALKKNLPDPVEYFLGRDFEAVLFPDQKSEYYGFPPSKKYVFTQAEQFHHQDKGFSPLVSFAQGGLAETWTGGVYPFNDGELADFPFNYQELQPSYEEVARRIGINGAGDDLARVFPVHGGLLAPLRLGEHEERLLARYARKKNYLNKSLGCYLGRSRLAVLSRDQGERKECAYRARCLWGCPLNALYTPSQTLAECKKHSNFHYRSNTYVRHFEVDGAQRVTGVVCETVDTRASFRVPAQTLVLAAGALMSSLIFLESMRQATGKIVTLQGLMDNRQVMVPFINLSMLSRPLNPDSYQYHQLAMGFEAADPRAYVHCQITTFKTALIHPIVQSAPFDLNTSLFLFRHLRSGLGLVNVNFPDNRRLTNYVTVEASPGSPHSRLVVHYEPGPDEGRFLKQSLAKVKKALWALGCIVPPGMTHVRPMGASVHYAGTIPISQRQQPLTASADCRSHDFENLFFVDGTTFPFLPAKNITFTLMANAVRVAEKAF